MTEDNKSYVIMLEIGDAEDWTQTPVGVFQDSQKAKEFCSKNNEAINVLKKSFSSISCDANDIPFLSDILSTMIFHKHEIKIGDIKNDKRI